MNKINISFFFFTLFLVAFSPFNQIIALTLPSCSKEEKNKGKQCPHPIQFSIPESKIVQKIPVKDLDFAPLIPGQLDTYIYERESEYYKDYQRSYYAVTCKKAGWDCLRHYEILANGCIPYFIDLDLCDLNTMYFLPRDLIREAMNLEGVSYLKIDHQKFDKAKYENLLKKLLAHTRKYLTTKAMASYLLKTIQYKGNGKILFLSYDQYPDYMRCLTLIGLRELLQDRLVDYPKIEHLYKSYTGNISELYGKGMTYSKTLEELPIDRNHIEERIKNKEFDLIIYGSVHRGLLFYDLVKQTYAPKKIIYICGEDCHSCEFINLKNLFIREFEGN
jgi:hypothetical protein